MTKLAVEERVSAIHGGSSICPCKLCCTTKLAATVQPANTRPTTVAEPQHSDTHFDCKPTRNPVAAVVVRAGPSHSVSPRAG
jgi:hypothetical protein